MRSIRILVVGFIAVGVPILSAGSAHATLTGPCTASGTIAGETYDAEQPSAVIPREGTVHWKGAISTGSGQRDIEGKVELELPPPFGGIVVANAEWDGESRRYRNQGRYEYDLPTILVGPKFIVSGHHAERGTVVCEGSMEVTVAGSKWKNPILLGSLVLTVIAVLNMALVIRAKEVAQ